MYYRIANDIALRSWADTGFAVMRRGGRSARRLTARQAEVMLACDGMHDLDTDATVMLLALQKLIEPCERGEAPTEWSALREYGNRYFPMMNLMITGRCNFNCLHCFNAADNNALATEWSFKDVCELLDQARDCGVASFMLTGGEPMMHRRFLDIVREIYRRDMTVFALNTNGSFISEETLAEMAALGCRPQIKISFDGIGTHDWMRNRAGAEKRAIDAMRLCADGGFHVVSNTQVNRRNIHTMMPTARLLDSIGVKEMRIIRTTEVPRWKMNAANACLGLEEYYERMLDFAAEYTSSGLGMSVEAWQYIGLIPRERSFYLKPVRFAQGEYRDDGCCCHSTSSMIAVSSSGEIMPCAQMSGYLMEHGMSFGNVRETPLKDLLSGGAYVDVASMTAGDLRAGGGKCGACPYFEFCGGGCRALGVLLTGERDSFLHEDLSKCIFFENGWYQKVVQALPGWTNLSEIPVG